KKTYKFSDIAILARANNHVEPFVRALSRKGIPYQFLGPGNLFKQPEVKDLIAYLKFLNTIDDSVSFYRVLSMNIFDLDLKDVASLLSFAKRTNCSLFQSLEIYLSFFYPDYYQKEFEVYKKYIPLLREQTRNKLNTMYLMIKRHLSLMKKETAGQILYFFLEDSKYLNALVSYKTERDEKIALNISKFFNKLKAFETEHEDASVARIVDYIIMSMELGESPSSSQTDLALTNAVNILTVHSAKGLEFSVVFLVNLTRGRFPTNLRKEAIPIPDSLIKEILPTGDYHTEEERRLFYVGMTRAKDKLYISSTSFYGEGKRRQQVSPFVIEALGEKIISDYQTIEQEKQSQLSMFAFEKSPRYQTKTRSVTEPTNSFSYSQLETYNVCPLQYKYQYVLNVPTSQNASTSFGNSIHKALQRFYKEFITYKSIRQDRLLEIYKETWIPLGYTSKRHEDRMKKEGQMMLIQFYKKFHSPNISILDIERMFKIKIDKELIIKGKIDRVDEKNKNEIEIIDYKTGKMPDKKELVKSMQLSIYALAAMDKGLYRKKIDEITLSFYYLQPMEKISFQPSLEYINETKKTIYKTVSQIRKDVFNANVGPWCDFCSFRMICEAWQ
ncbi:ATP-dependent helicase, partial [Candidatus Roizmanbacteria bacterium]|nr:ATP-dependent helicase [Candidatus Roizmanbacteria bacterium]